MIVKSVNVRGCNNNRKNFELEELRCDRNLDVLPLYGINWKRYGRNSLGINWGVKVG